MLMRFHVILRGAGPGVLTNSLYIILFITGIFEFVVDDPSCKYMWFLFFGFANWMRDTTAKRRRDTAEDNVMSLITRR